VKEIRERRELPISSYGQKPVRQAFAQSLQLLATNCFILLAHGLMVMPAFTSFKPFAATARRVPGFLFGRVNLKCCVNSAEP